MDLSGIVLFEDDGGINLEPVTAWNAPWDILFGCFSLIDRVKNRFSDLEVTGVRLGEHTTLPQGLVLFLNGRSLSLPELDFTSPGFLETDGELILAVLEVAEPFSGELLTWLKTQSRKVPSLSLDSKLATYFWDYTRANGTQIIADSKNLALGTQAGEVHEKACLLCPEKIYVGKESTVAPGAVLDASKGPIIIAEQVEIGANAVLTGPIFIDSESTVNPLTTIRPDVSLGFHSKVGGEVASTIMMPFTNKGHHGYLARSMVGSWCNLGAGSATSTLKNTYGEIAFENATGKISTGLNSLGCLIGDHVKIGTNVTLAPGASVGAFSNVVGSGPVPRYLAPFSWFDSSSGLQVYQLNKLIEVVTRVLARRNVDLSAQERKRIEELYSRI